MEKYKIIPFIVATCESPEPRLLYLGDPEKTLSTIFSFFLLKGKNKNILVDVGFTADCCKKYMPDVKHAHFDHLSSVVNEYKNARIHMQKKEYEFTINPPHPWFQELIDIDLLKEIGKEKNDRFNLIDGDSELFPGIKIITTAGHTAGHQSVLVDTESGEFCITGDAILNYRNLEEDVGPGFNTNLVECMQSIQKLRDLSEKGVKIIAGHDPKMLELL